MAKQEEVSLDNALEVGSDLCVPVQDADAQQLALFGYKQELKRNHSTWSIIAFGITITGTWSALAGALYGGIYAGGPPGVIYGFILIFVGQIFCGATVAELASSYPTTGGMYHWAALLAPPKWAPVLSYITGWNTVWAYVTSIVSIACVLGSQIMALASLAKPGWEISRWEIFLCLELLNIATLLMVLFGNKVFPMLQKLGLWFFICAFFVTVITILAMAPTHRTAKEVFVDFENNTGWSTNGWAFISGLVNPAFAIAAMDSTTHISEEVDHPEKNVPKAILSTLTMALISGWFMLMAMFFSYQDLDALLETATGLPIAELYRQATGSAAGAFGLTFLLLIAGLPSLWNTQLATGRIYWALARDNGVPFSKFFNNIHPTLNVPVRAHIVVAIVVALLGILYMWADTAFNAFIAANLVFFNVCYIVPISTNILRRRKTLIPGWFYMKKWGMLVNCIALCWTVFLAVFLEIPYYMPVTPLTMNYTCVIIGAGLLFEGVLFYFKRNVYTGPMLDEQLAQIIEGVNVAAGHHQVPVRSSMEGKSASGE